MAKWGTRTTRRALRPWDPALPARLGPLASDEPGRAAGGESMAALCVLRVNTGSGNWNGRSGATIRRVMSRHPQRPTTTFGTHMAVHENHPPNTSACASDSDPYINM